MAARFSAISSYPFAVRANNTLSSLKSAITSSKLSAVTIMKSTSLKSSWSGCVTIGRGGVTYSVSVIILAGGCTGFDEHAVSDKIIINPRTFTIKCFAIRSAPFIFCQRCTRL